MGDWDAIETQMGKLFETSFELFDSNIVGNMRDLPTACRIRCPLPDGMKKGYWSTVVIWWSNFEIEVFEDHLEIYRFHDRSTEIWYEEHTPGQTFSPKFLAELPLLVPKTGTVPNIDEDTSN